MSDGFFALVCLVCGLASIVGLWNNYRRRQSMRRLLRSLTPEQRRVIGLDPPEEGPEPREGDGGG